MKTFVNNLKISKEVIGKLTEEVKETLAFNEEKRNFSAIDLWNIRRRKKIISWIR